MEQYRQLASSVGAELSFKNQDAFNLAINTKNFDAAKESIRAVKKEIDDFRSAVSKMDQDQKFQSDIDVIAGKISQLREPTAELTTMLGNLQTASQKFDEVYYERETYEEPVKNIEKEKDEAVAKVKEAVVNGTTIYDEKQIFFTH